MSDLLETMAQLREEMDAKTKHNAEQERVLSESKKMIALMEEEVFKLPEHETSHVSLGKTPDSFTISRGDEPIVTLCATPMGVEIFFPGDDREIGPGETHTHKETILRIVGKSILLSKDEMPAKDDLGGVVRLWD